MDGIALNVIALFPEKEVDEKLISDLKKVCCCLVDSPVDSNTLRSLDLSFLISLSLPPLFSPLCVVLSAGAGDRGDETADKQRSSVAI
jgi:hypothetical protein